MRVVYLPPTDYQTDISRMVCTYLSSNIDDSGRWHNHANGACQWYTRFSCQGKSFLQGIHSILNTPTNVP